MDNNNTIATFETSRPILKAVKHNKIKKHNEKNVVNFKIVYKKNVLCWDGMGISKDNIELQNQSSILPMHERGPSPNGI